MENTNNDNSLLKHPIKPLFAAGSSGGLFPSATALYPESQDSCISHTDKVGLESLRLELAPSTLSAIIAAQKSLDEIGKDKESTELKQKDLQGSSKRKSPTHEDRSSEDGSSPEPTKRSKDSKKVKKKKKKQKKRKHHSPGPSPTPEQKVHPPQVKIPTGAIFLEDIPDLKPEHAFRTDRRQNKDLWNYGSVSKSHISKYKTHSYNCLGAAHLKIREPKKDTNKQTKWRYFNKKVFQKTRAPGISTTGSTKTGPIRVQDFIALPKADTDFWKTTLGSYSCLDQGTAQYVKGKDSDYSKLNLEVEDFELDEIFQKVRIFNQKTRETPQNVQLWLEFVQFQDVVAQEDKSFKGQTIRLRDVYIPSKSVIEKKLSILDKALEANPSSVELKLAKLELCQDVWEAEKLEKSWQDLLFAYSSDVDLWQQYLSNQQSQLFRFSFSKMVKSYHRCFHTLVPIHDGQVKVVHKKDGLEEKLIRLFSQYCDFLHSVGHTERAVSSYQALIEFNLFCPASLNLSLSRERVTAFEEFWESGVPRFGEPNARGWNKWVEKPQTETSTFIPSSENTDQLEDAIVLEKLTRSQSWLKMEEVRQNFHWLPWRPDTEKGETDENCEDLDRIVLFEDIGPAMFRFTKSESCVRIVGLFLKFLGLSSDVLDKKLALLSGLDYSSKFEQYVRTMLFQYPTLSDFNVELNCNPTWKPKEYLVRFIRDTIEQAESYFISTNRVLFTLLRMELEVLKTGAKRVSEVPQPQIKEIKKFGKNLLKESHNRNNLVVWDAYIRILWACSDKMAETVNMINVALNMFMGSSAPSDPEKSLGLCLLCRTFSQIMLNFEPLEHISPVGRRCPPTQDDKNQVIGCLGALVENKSFKSSAKLNVTPAYVLKIRKCFEKTLSEQLEKLSRQADDTHCELLTALVECFAMFEFSASNFKAANCVYSHAVSQLEALCDTNPTAFKLLAVKKHIYLNQMSFLFNAKHILVIPLTELRQLIDKALSEFQNCPQFHAAFIRIESGANIAGRLRKFYDRSLKMCTSVVVPLHAVFSELVRHKSIMKALDLADFLQTDYTILQDSGSVNRIRALFEHCVKLQASRHCPLVWRLYLMFEVKYGNMGRAKGIFYRALQHCPWAKCIYTDGISIFGDAELQEVQDLMTEKEVRVRIPIEEVDLLLTAEKEESDQEMDGGQEDKDLECEDGNYQEHDMGLKSEVPENDQEHLDQKSEDNEDYEEDTNIKPEDIDSENYQQHLDQKSEDNEDYEEDTDIKPEDIENYQEHLKYAGSENSEDNENYQEQLQDP